MMQSLIFPLEEYEVNGLPFGKRAGHNGEVWGVHLGEDILVPAGTDVLAIADGRVVYSAMHAGSAEKGNWGYIIILRHGTKEKAFYSLYGHLGACFKRIGEKVKQGEILGFIGPDYTPENGYWVAHLHFAVYTGPWKKQVLPGYWQAGDERTKPEWWQVPSEFILASQQTKTAS